MKAEQICQTCEYFFVGGSDTIPILECRRYAPRMVCGTGTGFKDWKWPNVNHDEFCGEWSYQEYQD